jgi:hypothetical protein
MSTSVTRSVAHLPINVSANTNHTMNGTKLPPARHLVLEQHPEGTYIFRYADKWDFSGDTWHANAEEALGQIEYEFDVTGLEWQQISEEALIALTNQHRPAQ